MYVVPLPEENPQRLTIEREAVGKEGDWPFGRLQSGLVLVVILPAEHSSDL